MEIVSWQFAAFSCLTLLGYFLLPRRLQNAWLLVFSLGFYATWRWEYTVILSGMILVNFEIARRTELSIKRKRAWFYLGLGINLLGLILFRLVSAHIGEGFIQMIFPAEQKASLLSLLLPLGFSFYALQAISYQIDVYQKRAPAERSLIDFGLYMAYFPKLLSGPIERAKTFIPRLKAARVVDDQAVYRGMTLIMDGLVRKMVLAELFFSLLPAHFFTEVVSIPPGTQGILALFSAQFSDPMPWGARWIGLLGYALYLYQDFAGYSNIVRGLSCFFGIELSVNFRQPYLATSFSDFWNRWHISLSHWLRDTIYFPLSRWLLNRSHGQRNTLNSVLPPMVTMLISGCWHGFSPAMLLWGGCHGIFQVLERYIPGIKSASGKPSLRTWALRGGIFLFVILAWVPFGSQSIEQTVAFWRALISPFPLAAFGPAQWLTVGIGLLCFLYDWICIFKNEVKFWQDAPGLARTATLSVAFGALIIAVFWNMNAAVRVFIYQGF